MGNGGGPERAERNACGAKKVIAKACAPVIWKSTARPMRTNSLLAMQDTIQKTLIGRHKKTCVCLLCAENI